MLNKIPADKQALNRHERRAAAIAKGDPDINVHILADFLDEDELSHQLNIGARTLREWRRTGRGPPFVQVGRRIVYRLESIRAWLLTHERRPPRERAGRRQAQPRTTDISV
jgi:hypothetical protein